MLHRSSILAVLVGALMPLAGCGWHFNTYQKARGPMALDLPVTHQPDAALEVRTRNGSIDVIADPSLTEMILETRMTCAGNTQAEAADRLALASIRAIHRDDGTLVIEPVFPGGERDGDGASFVIQLPGATGLTLHTSNGSVKAIGFSGPIDIDTSNSGVTLIDHEGDAIIDTSNGPIVVRNLVGSLIADTSNASVNLEHITGSVVADSSNGSIKVVLGPSARGPLHLDTSNASISARVGSAFASDIRLSTSNASITVNDRSGRVRTQTLSRSRGHVIIGEGGESSRLDTSNASITLTIEG